MIAPWQQGVALKTGAFNAAAMMPDKELRLSNNNMKKESTSPMVHQGIFGFVPYNTGTSWPMWFERGPSPAKPSIVSAAPRPLPMVVN